MEFYCNNNVIYIYIHRQEKNIKVTTNRKVVNIISSTIISLSIIILLFFTIYSLIVTNSTQKHVKQEISNITKLENININERYIPVLKNEKYGFIDEYGKERISCDYDGITPFICVSINNQEYEIALALKEGKYRLITKENLEIMLDETMEKVAKNIYNHKPYEDGTLKITTYSLILQVLMDMSGYSYENKSFPSNTRNNQKEITLDLNENNDYEYICSNYSITISNEESKYKKVTMQKKNGKEISNIEYIPVSFERIKLYDDGYIPFCNLNEEIQGWYDNEGNRRTIKGKFQILEIRNDIITLINYEKNTKLNEIIFMDMLGNIVLQAAGVEVLDNGYLIENESGNIIQLDNELRQLSEEYNYMIFSTQMDMSNQLSSFMKYSGSMGY